jgi:flagellar basal-body rod protein FlgB
MAQPSGQVSLLLDATSRILRNSLDASAWRERVIANNLANIETPNFQAQDVSFTEHLRAALKSVGDSEGTEAYAALEAVTPTLVQATDGTPRLDGNTVDIDAEMTKLTETSGLYDAVARMLQARLEMLRLVINEGRR